jgi:hypothetical protein
MMLCGLPLVEQTAIGICLSFDPFSFDQNSLASAGEGVNRQDAMLHMK